jgi:hypothetical protein
MEPQSQGDTAAPGKQKARQQQAHVQQDFLFIDSSKPAQTSRQGRRTARSFVMQRARRERPWSTSKHAGKQAPSRRSPDSASVGTPDAYHTPFTQPTTPTTPGDVSLAGDVDLARVADNNSFFLAKPILCRECHILACQPGQPLCARCLSLPPSHASSLPPDSLAVAEGAMDPFRSFPIEVDSRVSELLNHCESAPSCPLPSFFRFRFRPCPLPPLPRSRPSQALQAALLRGSRSAKTRSLSCSLVAGRLTDEPSHEALMVASAAKRLAFIVSARQHAFVSPRATLDVFGGH